MTTAVRKAFVPAQRPGEPEALRRQFDRDAIWQRMVRPGDRLPSGVLLEADLGPIHLDRLRITGSVVLVFVKHGASELDAAALAAYQQDLLPGLAGTDAHLVAVSPQIPRRLAEVKRLLDLSYLVAADPRHVLIDAFNLGFAEPGADRILGAGRSVLPFPAVVVADRTGVVRYAEVRPDGSPHPRPSEILAAVRALS